MKTKTQEEKINEAVEHYGEIVKLFPSSSMCLHRIDIVGLDEKKWTIEPIYDKEKKRAFLTARSPKLIEEKIDICLFE